MTPVPIKFQFNFIFSVFNFYRQRYLAVEMQTFHTMSFKRQISKNCHCWVRKCPFKCIYSFLGAARGGNERFLKQSSLAVAVINCGAPANPIKLGIPSTFNHRSVSYPRSS
jgi:hypothetical protein